MKIVLGTRGSQLAVRQSEELVAHLRSAGHTVEWKRFTTHGDQWLTGPLGKETGTGFFTRELEAALLAGDVDMLIHSFKDVSLVRPQGIATACVPRREDPADLLVMRSDAPEEPVIGTSSERRLRFLAKALPRAAFTWIRGNVPTRLQRVRDGELRGGPLHGTVLAAAGLRRLGVDLSGLDVRPLDPHELLPRPPRAPCWWRPGWATRPWWTPLRACTTPSPGAWWAWSGRCWRASAAAASNTSLNQ